AVRGWFGEFSTGSNRYAYNVLAGRTGERDLWIFDHHHETYSTDSKGRRTTHHHHVTCLLLQHDLDLGNLRLRPEHLFDKLKAAFGFDDIDFESAEFSRRFHVSGEDRKLAYDVFHPRMIEYLLARTHLTLATGAFFFSAVGAPASSRFRRSNRSFSTPSASSNSCPATSARTARPDPSPHYSPVRPFWAVRTAHLVVAGRRSSSLARFGASFLLPP
ncbi:MAG: DUF3137 domain-containing protein, partial [Planctomycetes bacterium]|nr:DUF3137 domain-containing protein [Planctomycetota bacterium]